MSKKWVIIFVFLCLLSIWELFSRSSSQLLFVLPPPSLIISTIFENPNRFMFHTWVTFKEMAAGFLLALTCAFPLAWMMMRSVTSRLFLQPIFIMIQCLPMFTLAPLMVIWFGWNFIAIVIPTALMIFFPLTLNIYQGIRSTPSALLDFFKINGASHFQTFFKLRLPWALPHIFAGLRISAAISGIGAIAGEWAGAQEGLGILMLESRRNVDLEMTFGALFLLTLLSALFYAVILLLETFSSIPRKKIGYKPLLLMLTMLSISSCSQQKPQTRLLLDWLPNPNHVPLYVGLKKGYFEEEGIHLIIQKMPDSGGGLSFLTSRQTELLISYLPSVMKAQAKGAHLKIVGLLVKEPLSAFIARQTGVDKPSDLTGKTLGYCLGGSDTAFLDFILKQGNISPSHTLNVGIDLLTTMSTKKVDFIYGGFWNIEPFQLQSLNIETRCFKNSELGVPNYYEMIIMANANSKESDPLFVQAFQRALQKSVDDCKNDPSTAFAIYQSYHPDKRKKTLTWEKEAWNATYPILASDQTIDQQMLLQFYAFLQNNHVLKGSFNPLFLIP